MDDLVLDGGIFRVDKDGDIEILYLDDEWLRPQHGFYLDLNEELRLRDWLNERHERRSK